MLVSRLQIRCLLGLFPLTAAPGPPGEEVGSKVCSGCHAEIYRRYSATSMSRSSGTAGASAFRESFDRAGFTDPASGAKYRVSAEPAGYTMEFSRVDSGVQG